MLGLQGGRPRLRGAQVAAIGAAMIAPPLLWASSCALDGFNRVDGPAPADAAIDAGCAHASYPPPPEVTGSGGDKEFVVALRSIDFGEAAGGPDVGLDLDRLCTCQGDGPECLPLRENTEACDGPEGRDNAAAKVFSLLRSAVGADAFGSEYYSARAELGDWSILLRVGGYNGALDDDRVRLDWYVAPNFDIQGGPAVPAWDGNDAWPISAVSFNLPDGGVPADAGGADLDDTRFTDPNAYVTNGVMVAALPETSITLAGSLSRITLLVSGAFVVAPIEPMLLPAGDGYRLQNAMLVGRWKVNEVFNSISSFRDESGAPFCTDGLFYSVGKSKLCEAADILSNTGSPTMPCDALSIGVLFQTYPAKLGSIFTPPDPTPGCPPATDPATDSCN